MSTTLKIPKDITLNIFYAILLTFPFIILSVYSITKYPAKNSSLTIGFTLFFGVLLISCLYRIFNRNYSLLEINEDGLKVSKYKFIKWQDIDSVFETIPDFEYRDVTYTCINLKKTQKITFYESYSKMTGFGHISILTASLNKCYHFHRIIQSLAEETSKEKRKHLIKCHSFFLEKTNTNYSFTNTYKNKTQ